jgi:hypothetical protein
MQQAVVNTKPPSSGGTNEFITSVSGGTPNSTFTGYAGMQIVMGGTSKTLTNISFWCSSGSNAAGTSFVYVTDTSNTIIANGTATLTGCSVGTFVHVAVSGTLTSGTTYNVLGSSVSGVGSFLSNGTTLTSTGIATFKDATSASTPGTTPTSVSPGTSGAAYIPMSFTYL